MAGEGKGAGWWRVERGYSRGTRRTAMQEHVGRSIVEPPLKKLPITIMTHLLDTPKRNWNEREEGRRGGGKGEGLREKNGGIGGTGRGRGERKRRVGVGGWGGRETNMRR